MKLNRWILKILWTTIIIMNLTMIVNFATSESINVGIYQNPPLLGVDAHNIPEGLFVELLNYIALEEDLSLSYKYDTLENCFNSLERGDLDIVLGIAYSESRATKYLFSDETIYTNWGQIYSAPFVTLDSFLDLEGKRIGVEKDDIHYIGENGIKNILIDFGISAEFIEYSTRMEMFSALETGKIDAGVVSRLFGEFNDANFNIQQTPIQFNPIKIKVIAYDSSNQYLLDAFDKHIIDLKKAPDSLYYKALDRLMIMDTTQDLSEGVKSTLALMVVILLGMIIIIYLGRRIIKKQSIELLEQNNRLKELVKHISELSNIKTMGQLFSVLTFQIRSILKDDQIQLISVIEYADGLYFDSEEYLTEKYKDLQLKRVDMTQYDYFDNADFFMFKNSDEQIKFGNHCIIVKFDSSYNRQGYLYIEIEDWHEDREFLQIYLTDIITNLQKIISNIIRTNEKTKMFIALGELIEKRDHHVANHVKRVSEATKFLASACGYDDERLNNIVIASSVHDVGKIFVPDSILNKPGKLTDEEFEIIKRHATDDLKIIQDFNENLSKSVHDVVRYHHENWDGSGYPEGLCDEDIPLDARIVSMVDVFEALTHERPYKNAWQFEEACAFIIDHKGKKFDPHLVEVFEPISKQIYEIFMKYKDA